MSFNDIKKSFLSWLADVRIYKGGIVLFGESNYKIKGQDEREILKVIQPGDILLRKYENYLGSKAIALFSGTYWSHCAIYIGNYDNEDGRVIHILGPGIENDDLLSFMRADNLMVLRCTKENLIQDAINTAIYYYEKNTEYDYDFDFNNEKFYCSEFVMRCFNNPVFYNRISENIIYPDDFLNSIFNIVWKKE